MVGSKQGSGHCLSLQSWTLPARACVCPSHPWLEGCLLPRCAVFSVGSGTGGGGCGGGSGGGCILASICLSVSL